MPDHGPCRASPAHRQGGRGQSELDLTGDGCVQAVPYLSDYATHLLGEYARNELDS